MNSFIVRSQSHPWTVTYGNGPRRSEKWNSISQTSHRTIVGCPNARVQFFPPLASYAAQSTQVAQCKHAAQTTTSRPQKPAMRRARKAFFIVTFDEWSARFDERAPCNIGGNEQHVAFAVRPLIVKLRISTDRSVRLRGMRQSCRFHATFLAAPRTSPTACRRKSPNPIEAPRE